MNESQQKANKKYQRDSKNIKGYGPWYPCDNSGTTARTGLNLVLLDTPAWLRLKSLNSWQLSKVTWEASRICNKKQQASTTITGIRVFLGSFRLVPKYRNASRRQGVNVSHCITTPGASAARSQDRLRTLSRECHVILCLSTLSSWRTAQHMVNFSWPGSGLESLSKADLCTVGYVPSGRFRFSALWV